MHPADTVILVAIAASILFGVFRGFVREAFSLAGWFAAFVVARLYHAPLEAMLVDHIGTPSVRLVVAWGGLFVTTLLLAFLAAWLVMSLVDAAGVRGVDRLLGAVFGLARGLLLVLAVLIVAAPFVSRDAWWEEARLPREFMRYELLGRELKAGMVKAASSVGKPAASPVDAPPPDRQD